MSNEHSEHLVALLFIAIIRGKTLVDTPTNLPYRDPPHTEALTGLRHTDARTIPKG